MSAPTTKPITYFTPSNTTDRGGLGKWILVGITVLFLTSMIVFPALNIFRQALGLQWESFKSVSSFTSAIKEGAPKFIRTFYVPTPAHFDQLTRSEKRAITGPQSQAEKTRSAIWMTISIVAIVVPLNTVFGISAAWLISKFKFRGRTLLISMIDLPFAVSPVIAGLIFVLLMGRQGFFGDYATNFHWPSPLSLQWTGFDHSWWPIGFSEWHTGVIFTPIATVLASMFVTFPFVARSLIPLMETQGVDQEQAALTLGASGWKMFWHVTLPQIKWALLYGMILCSARCLGEFGAVSVVSGHLDSNDTMPLRIEKLWQEYNTQGAFAVASVLALLSIISLVLKVIIEWKTSTTRQRDKAKAL